MGEENSFAYIKILKEEYLEYERLNNFFMLSADLICIAGFDGYFKKINPAVSNLLGYTEEELFASPINDFVYTDDKQVTSTSRGNIHRGKPLTNFENRYLTKNGEVIWLSWTSIPDQERQVVFAIAKNVTEKKRQEEDRAIYTRMTSHDIRSPVSNLLSIFSLLDISKIEDPATAEMVKLLEVTSNRLNEIVNDFVDVVIKSDQLKVPIERLNLSNCLSIVNGSVSSLIADSGAIIESDFRALNTVIFNKIYLESIFLNLITNAIKYAHPDRAPQISISTQIVGDIQQLVFADNGLGMNLDLVKDKIFGLYQVFHDRPDSKGIGLHLVYTHITSLGGEITVQSKVNEGTTFTISFKH